MFDVQQKNRLSQKGLLKRFSIICYGHQESVEEMKSLKAKKIVELKNKKGTPEYDEWFLKYNPGDAYARIDKKNGSSPGQGQAPGQRQTFKPYSKTRKHKNSMKQTKKQLSRYRKKPKTNKKHKYWKMY